MDSGENFKSLHPKVSNIITSSKLLSVLSYPDIGKILMIHGSNKMVTLLF
jgi:hypothetical protein